MTRFPLSSRPSFARRVVLAPVLIGAFALLAAACSSDIDGSAASSTTAASTTTLAPTTSADPTTTAPTTTLPPTTTTAPLVTSPGVVKVANASGVDGAAGVLTDEFEALGFDTRKATNGAGIDADLKVSKIYVVPGSEEVGRSVSRLMGGIELLPMPTPVWITGANENLADATVLVMLGHDLAGKKLKDMAG